jgi:hypothetical protein
MSDSEYKRVLQQFQSERLRRDYADLAAEPQYAEVGEFFFNEMYGTRDFTTRDSQARRLHQFVHAVPGVNIGDVQQVLELLDLTNRLDDAVTAQLLALDAGLDFDEPTYERAYRLANNYDDRVTQLELVRRSFYNVQKMAHSPITRLALDRTERLAHMVGMAEIHRFLRRGYYAVLPVKDIYRFVETIYTRELNRLDRIFAGRLAA